MFHGENVAVSRSARLRVAVLIAPLALQVLLLRLLTYSMMRRAGNPDVGELLRSNAPLPLLLLFCVPLFLAWTHTAWPTVRPFWRVAAAAAFTVALCVLTAAAAPWWLTEWLSPDALAFVRTDLLFLLLLGTGAVMALHTARGRVHRLLCLLLHLAVFGMMLLSAVTFGYFAATGAPVDWHVLRYFTLHASDLMQLVASEIDGARASLLVLPLLVTLLPIVVGRVPRVRSWIRMDPGSDRRLTPWRWALRSLPFLVLLAVPPASRTPLDYRSGSLVYLIHDMTADALGTEEAPVALSSASGPLFDTRELRLAPTDSTRRMNVVFIVLESVRSRSATPYEPSLPTMPFLDTLARRSLMVEQMFTVVPHTNKSLTAMFAGIYPKLSRDIAEAKPGGIPGVGFPALLRPFDYQSAFFTPATLAYEDKDQLLANLGFDAAYGAESYPPEGFSAKEYFGYEDRIVLAPSLDWVDEATQQGGPFFLAYLTLSSHHPYDLPDSFARQAYPTPNTVLNDYYNALRYTDEFLRDLIAGFEARGLIDNTLFVIVGDHGEAFGEHRQRTHGDVIWDEGLQVPALLYSPRLFPEGSRITGLRQHIDFLPTLAQALGYRLEGGHYPGRSLLEPIPADRTLYHSSWNGDLSLALRRDTLKFIYNHGRSPMQVFDVENDPLEENDLAASYPAAVLRAVQLDLLLWRAGVARAYDREAWHLARAGGRR